MEVPSQPKEQGFKITQNAIEINGVHTEVICTGYTDRIHIIITQLGKPGSMMKLYQESKSPMNETEESYHISTIFGKRDDVLHQLIARQLVEMISKKTKRQVLLNIALDPKFVKQISMDSPKPFIKPILDLVEKGKVW